jgi:cell division protein FtsI (penicillin-binding protein 3)
VISRWVRFRLILAALVMTGLFTALGAKAWTLQVRDGARMRALGEEQYLKELVLPAPRGAIRDANGVELALSVQVPSAFVNPREVGDVAGSAAAVAQALKLDVREVEEKLASGRHFEWLKRHISVEEARKLRALALPGIGTADEPQRFYPGRELAGTLLGFADIDGRGVEGLELSLDEKLRGERAKLPVIRDRRGEVVIDGEAPISVAAGASVTLTIDRFIQYSAERALADGIRENKAKAGVAIVLDPKSGAILAMTSFPGLDPNAPAKDGRDRPVVDAYEPGSVMKVFSVVSALDAGAVKPGDTVDVEGGRLQLGKHVITDTHKGLGVIPVGEVITVSSNVGAVKIARRLGAEKLHDGLAKLGFGSRTGVELPGELRGRLRDAGSWGEAGLATVAYGYGMQATPLQVAAALQVVAAGGVAYRPFIVRRVVDGEGHVVSEAAPEPRPVLSDKAARDMTAMMKTVTQKGGTASKLSVPGFLVAGKTGTAYKHDPVTHKYSTDKYLASFIGFVPADDPRLAIVVMIDEPSAGKHFGGDVSAPVFATIASETLKYLGVPATEKIEARPASDVVEIDPRAVRDAEREAVPDEEVVESGDLVALPDFTGMSVAQALALAQTRGIKLEIEGTGRATRQFPPPGRAVKSITCHVTFDPG